MALFFWPDHPRDDFNSVRDHGEAHDISGPDRDGDTWRIEVKHNKWASNAGSMWSFLIAAFEQALRYAAPVEGRVAACWLPKHARAKDALVMYKSDEHGWVTVPAIVFKTQVLGLTHEENDDD